MHSSTYISSLVVGVPTLVVLFYGLPPLSEVDRVFVTSATFLFSIFTGFFISHQASRFNAVRESVTAFDGKLTNIYRTCGHINTELQKNVGERIITHYEKILSTGVWDIHYQTGSTTLKDIHSYLDNYIDDSQVSKISNQAIGSVVKGLDECQKIRKRIIALRDEGIPTEQWILIIFFSLTLLLAITTLPSQYMLVPSIIKSAFVASVSAVLLILYRLTTLQFSETMIGKHSAEDVLAIVRPTT